MDNKSEFRTIDLVRHHGGRWSIYDNRLGLCSDGHTIPEALRNMAICIEHEERTGATARMHVKIADEAKARREGK